MQPRHHRSLNITYSRTTFRAQNPQTGRKGKYFVFFRILEQCSVETTGVNALSDSGCFLFFRSGLTVKIRLVS